MKILIVIDMQNDFVIGSLGTKQAELIVPKVAKKVASFAEDKNIVVFTRDTHDLDYLNTFEGKNLPIEHCIKGTHGWQIVDQLKVYAEKSNAIIDKPTFGSFELLDFLEPLVKKDDVEEIEICGLCTDICVVANALLLRTKFPEMPIKVDATCCAGVTEESHNCALKTMQSCQIEVVY
jgi:nicotinamidase/pyrazinamidase